jgi:hypothetical protein
MKVPLNYSQIRDEVGSHTAIPETPARREAFLRDLFSPYEGQEVEHVLTWLRVRFEACRPGGPEGKYPNTVGRLVTDAQHSALLRRLRSGKEPFPYPPPVRYSRPWYAIMEEPEQLLEEGNLKEYDRIHPRWDQTRRWFNAAGDLYIHIRDLDEGVELAFPDTPYRFQVVRAPKGGWAMSRIKDGELLTRSPSCGIE